MMTFPMYGENNKFVPNHQPEDASFFMVLMGKSRQTLRDNSCNMWELVSFFPVFDGKQNGTCGETSEHFNGSDRKKCENLRYPNAAMGDFRTKSRC